MDPLSLIALGAAVGSASSKFVEKAWDSGEKWIGSYFKDHKEKAQEIARINSIDFLNELANKIKILEDTSRISQEKIEFAQDHPDFSVILQKSLIASSQTASKEKHIVLARLVSERLCSEPESIFSLASKMACDAVSYMTVNQLNLLGLLTILYSIRPTVFPPQDIAIEQYQNWMNEWIYNRLYPFKDIIIGNLDLNHLESLSCLRKVNFISRQLNDMFSIELYKYSFENHPTEYINTAIPKLWIERKLEGVDLTTVGQIIGVMAADQISNSNTSFVGWE